MNQPNIVLLVLDTQRADRLSCYGHHLETTPHLDEFAANATRFTHAISPAQWTLPAHASMFTGLYPSQHTMQELNSVLPTEIETVAERLQQARYYNAIFSNNPLIGAKKNGLQRGFDEISVYHYAGLGFWTSHLSQVGMHEGKLSQARYQLRKLLSTWLGYGQTPAAAWVSNLISPLVEWLVKRKSGSKTENAQQALNQAAKLLINGNNNLDQPVFAFINLMGTHIPYNPPKWALKRFAPFEKRLSSARLNHINTLAVNVRNWLKVNHLSNEDKALLAGVYDAEVAEQDRQIGEFIDLLKAGGVWDDTAIIIVADHGEHLGEKERISHLIGAYEPLLHVPLLIKDPQNRLAPGSEQTEFVSTRRIFHTILDFGKTTIGPEKEESLLNISSNKTNQAFAQAQTPKWVIEQLEQQFNVFGHNKLSQALYYQAHKLIVTDESIVELYNLYDDPTEQDNLVHTLPEQSHRLQQLLQVYNEETQPVVIGLEYEEEDPAILNQLRQLGYIE